MIGDLPESSEICADFQDPAHRPRPLSELLARYQSFNPLPLGNLLASAENIASVIEPGMPFRRFA
jgi:hypothetical protein